MILANTKLWDTSFVIQKAGDRHFKKPIPNSLQNFLQNRQRKKIIMIFFQVIKYYNDLKKKKRFFFLEQLYNKNTC